MVFHTNSAIRFHTHRPFSLISNHLVHKLNVVLPHHLASKEVNIVFEIYFLVEKLEGFDINFYRQIAKFLNEFHKEINANFTKN